MTPDNSISSRPAIVWFRNDLRVRDNAALLAASAHAAVLPIYILETGSAAGSIAKAIGGARRWWLHHALERLDEKLADLGTSLILLSGDPAALIPEIVETAGASAVYWNRRYDPSFLTSDADLKRTLQSRDIVVESFAGQLLHEPTRVRTGSDTFYKVYSPFWRAIEGNIEDRPPAPAPDQLAPLRDATQIRKAFRLGAFAHKPGLGRRFARNLDAG
jgi:deoxyribodipyrimidine photo-lyase